MEGGGYDRPFTGKQGSVALPTGVVSCHARQHWRCRDYHRHQGGVTFLNPVAQSLTGWTLEEAAGQPLDSVFRIINEESRQPVESPTVRALREGVVVGLANHSLLIAKDGTERPIDDSAAPIRNEQGRSRRGRAGVPRHQRTQAARAAGAGCPHLRRQHHCDHARAVPRPRQEPAGPDGQSVLSTGPSTSRQEETEGRYIYELGNGQWNIPRLLTLLEGVLSNSHPIHDFDVEHDFPAIGKKIMLLNARRFESVDSQPDLILLAIEDITERKQAEVAVQTSEVRYRRLFQTAKDGILILDANTLKIIDANPFMTELLGYSHDEFLGKELWEIGLFGDERASQAAYQELQEKGYIRYDHLPLETKNGERAEVEFVSNVYQVDHRPVAQCNIRDISERRLPGEADNGAGGSVVGPAPPQGRVPGDAVPRTPQPSRSHPQRRPSPPSPKEARTPSSNKPETSLSVRWGNCHVSSMTCWKSPASPPAGFSFARSGSP